MLHEHVYVYISIFIMWVYNTIVYVFIVISMFLRWSLMIFIIKGFRTIVFIFIVISTMFKLICPLAFFRCLSKLGTYTEIQTTSFIESTGIACSDSVSHNWVQVLSIGLVSLIWFYGILTIVGYLMPNPIYI